MPKIRNIIIFIVIALVVILIYIFFIQPILEKPEEGNLVSLPAGATLPNMDGSNSSTNTANADVLMTKDLLTLFSSVKTIKLNDAIFSDQAFGSLHDTPIDLKPDGTEGRPNPFAQLGVDVPVAPVPSLPSILGEVPTAPALKLPATPAAGR